MDEASTESLVFISATEQQYYKPGRGKQRMKSSQETCYIGIGIFGREKNRHFVLFPLPFLVEKYFILIVHDSDRSYSV